MDEVMLDAFLDEMEKISALGWRGLSALGGGVLGGGTGALAGGLMAPEGKGMEGALKGGLAGAGLGALGGGAGMHLGMARAAKKMPGVAKKMEKLKAEHITGQVPLPKGLDPAKAEQWGQALGAAPNIGSLAGIAGGAGLGAYWASR